MWTCTQNWSFYLFPIKPHENSIELMYYQVYEPNWEGYHVLAMKIRYFVFYVGQVFWFVPDVVIIHLTVRQNYCFMKAENYLPSVWLMWVMRWYLWCSRFIEWGFTPYLRESCKWMFVINIVLILSVLLWYMYRIWRIYQTLLQMLKNLSNPTSNVWVLPFWRDLVL